MFFSKWLKGRRGELAQFNEKEKRDAFFQEVENRKVARIFPPLTLKFLTSSKEGMEESRALIKDISMDGARIETKKAIHKGNMIEAQICSPELKPIEIVALVVRERVHERRGTNFHEVGLQFIEIDDESRERFRNYLIKCVS